MHSAPQPSNGKDVNNWLLHALFLRQDYKECLTLIEKVLKDSDGHCEYATYLKALILRIKGQIHESLDLFKKCHLLDPANPDYLKQFGRSLYLIGRHKLAIDVFDDCLNFDHEDWEVYFYKGLTLQIIIVN